MSQAPFPSGPTPVVSRGHLIELHEPLGAIEALLRDRGFGRPGGERLQADLLHGHGLAEASPLLGAPLDGVR